MLMFQTTRTMPPRRVAPPLQLYSAREFGSQVVRVLVRIEAEIVAIRRCHLHPVILDNGVNSPPAQYTDTLAKIEAKYAQLVKYLEAIPGVLMDQIFRATTDVYMEKYSRIDQGDDLLQGLFLGTFFLKVGESGPSLRVLKPKK